MTKTFDEASDLQTQLMDTASRLVDATRALEEVRLLKRTTAKEVDSLRAEMFAEQSALGETGLFKGKTNKEGREAMFETFFREQDLPAVNELKQLEVKEVNLKIAEFAESTRFDALKKVADLQIRKLEYETQTVALQSTLKQIEAQKKI